MPIHQTFCHKSPRIQHVALMSTLQLGEHLTVKIKMPEIHLSNPSNKRTSLALTKGFHEILQLGSI